MEPNNEQAWYWAGETDKAFIAPWDERRNRARHQRQKLDRPSPRLPYEIVLHDIPIGLDEIEFRIVTFLSNRPYYAFSPQQITSYVNEQQMLMAPEDLHQHIVSLRIKLGFFRDFVQSVPHIGYRFRP